MKLTLLGTGHALTFKYFNTCFLLEENQELFLVDGGGGNCLFNQIEKAGYNWQSIRTVFVTHKHIDHLLGIVWYIRRVANDIVDDNFEGDVTIYSHKEVISLLTQMATNLLRPVESDLLGKRIHMVALNHGDEFSALGHNAQAFDMGSKKATQFGFVISYGEEKAGAEKSFYEEHSGGEHSTNDGISSGEEKPFNQESSSSKGTSGTEKKLACCGDEPYRPHLEPYIRNCTWLLHEAFCLYAEAEKYRPYEISHSTAKDAAEVAEMLGISNLVLYHTEEDTYPHRKELYTAEAKRHFSGTVYVPEDLESFEL
ncbi:MAG: MBL fold metallo-hydrolase [Anaerotardibacter sp.]